MAIADQNWVAKMNKLKIVTLPYKIWITESNYTFKTIAPNNSAANFISTLNQRLEAISSHWVKLSGSMPTNNATLKPILI